MDLTRPPLRAQGYRGGRLREQSLQNPLGGDGWANYAKRQFHNTDPDDITIGEWNWALRQATSNGRAILAPEILERRMTIRDVDPRMTSRNTRRIENKSRVGVPSDDVFAFAEHA